MHNYLLAFARVIDEGVIINQFLCCKNLPSTIKGQDVFDILTTHRKKHGLSWDSCVGACTDRAPSMEDSIKGLYLSWKNTILLQWKPLNTSTSGPADLAVITGFFKTAA